MQCSAVQCPSKDGKKTAPPKKKPLQKPLQLVSANQPRAGDTRSSSILITDLVFFCIESMIKTSKRSANPFKANESIAAPFG